MSAVISRADAAPVEARTCRARARPWRRAGTLRSAALKKPEPRLMRLTPAADEHRDARAAGQREHVDRPGDRRADRADVLDVAQARRVEHVGAGLLEGLQPRDRVVEVGAAVQEVLGARRERERERQRARRPRRPPRCARRPARAGRSARRAPVESSIEQPTRPAAAAPRIVSATLSGSWPKPFSRSPLTGSRSPRRSRPRARAPRRA